MYPVGFDYSPKGIAQIPCETVRKFGGQWHDGRFGYMEGVRIKALQDAGKRVIGTYDITDHLTWSTMPDSEWQGYVERFVVDCRTLKVCEVGNEPGKSMIDGYLRKLKVASDVLRAAGVWVLMGAPYPGAEGAFWDAAATRGAFGWVDAVACHPYAKTPDDSLVKVQGFRAHLDALGANKRLHLTEFGWPTANAPRNPGLVDEPTQATYVRQAFNNWRAYSEALKLNNCLLYTLNDGMPGPAYGVIRADGTRKPAYDALAAA